ncbi:unnamed protein product, partial [marine sediment metagenome]
INLAISSTNSVAVGASYIPITGFRIIDAFIINALRH